MKLELTPEHRQMIESVRALVQEKFKPQAMVELSTLTGLLNGGQLPPGSIQRATLGSGMWHSERNGSATEPMRFLQFWILPAVLGQPWLRLYLLAEHTGCPLVPDMLANTRTTFTNPVVKALARAKGAQISLAITPKP